MIVGNTIGLYLFPPATRKDPILPVFQRHLPTFQRMWMDTQDGGCPPKFVTEALQKFLESGILADGFPDLHRENCHK